MSRGSTAVWLSRPADLKTGRALSALPRLKEQGMMTGYLWWRCAYGKHPFSSRTRWLRRKRPMVLCWRRYGRAGGCQIHLADLVKRYAKSLRDQVMNIENRIPRKYQKDIRGRCNGSYIGTQSGHKSDHNEKETCITLYTRERSEDDFEAISKLLMIKLIRAQGGCLGTESR